MGNKIFSKEYVVEGVTSKLIFMPDHIIYSHKDSEDIGIEYNEVYNVDFKAPSMLGNGYVCINQYKAVFSKMDDYNEVNRVLDTVKQNMMSIEEIEAMKAEEARQRLEQEERLKKLEEERKREEEQLRRQALARLNDFKKSNMLTTGYNFDGYTIKEYKGIVSGDIVLGTGVFTELGGALSDLFGASSNMFSYKMKKAKWMAQEELSLNALELSANAIIGIDIDYQVLGNNMIAVSMNGTAVVIEKNKE